MKNRHGFVSNSSSASFVVPKSKLSYEEGKILLGANHTEKMRDDWFIEETGETIEGWTDMDNYELEEYLKKVGFDVSKIEWNPS